MKHLVLSPMFPPARYGGIEIIAERLCTAMASTEEVLVLSVTPSEATVRHRWVGPVEVWEVPGHFFSPLATDAANAAVMDVARRLMRGVDIVHCHDWFLADAACLLTNREVPLIGYFHTVKAIERSCLGSGLTASRRYSEDKQEQLARHSDIVAVYSDFMNTSVSQALNVPAERLVTFVCGPTLPLKRRPIPERPQDGGFRVQYVGRLAAEKGVDILMQAFLRLSAGRAAPTLRVRGSGPIADELLETAENGADDRTISFEPFTTDPVALIRAYAESDLVVVPSRFEPHGLVAAEALSLGVPVAVAATGGLPQTVRWGEYGDVFAAGDADELLHVLETVRGDHEAYTVKAALGREVHADVGLWYEAARTVLRKVPGASEDLSG